MQEFSKRPDAGMQRVRAFDIDRLDWDDLRIFVVAAREGSLRKAATVLRISSSTIVRRIERLESLLGVGLFSRVPEGVTLTAEGQRILQSAQEMERASHSLRRFLDPDLTARGIVRIAVSEGLGTYWILPHLAAFNRQHPFTVVDMRTTMDYADVLRMRADFAVQLTRPTAPDVIATKLGRLHIYPFAARRYLDEYGHPENKEALKRHRLVDQTSPMLDEGMIPMVLGLTSVEGVIAMRTNASSAHYEAVAQGIGIGALPTYAVVLGADLVPIDVDLRHEVDIWLTYHPDMRSIPRVSLMIDWMKSLFDQAQYPWFSDEFVHPDALRPHRATFRI